MRRVLLISLSLVLALAGWSTVGAEDGFYVIPAMKGNYAPVPKTGQTTSYATGDDGALQKGVAWPTPRFTDNGNGTVTDNLTRLIWMKNANAFGTKTWDQALSAANGLKSADGTMDGSQAGDWRLPNIKELQSLVDYGSNLVPLLPAGHPFTSVQPSTYWSSSTYVGWTTQAWYVEFDRQIVDKGYKSASRFVWCVRGGPTSALKGNAPRFPRPVRPPLMAQETTGPCRRAWPGPLRALPTITTAP